MALIKGKNPDKKVTALRADMDALPITEENDVPYKSKNVGVILVIRVFILRWIALRQAAQN